MRRQEIKSLVSLLCTMVIITTLILTSACSTKTTTSTQTTTGTQETKIFHLGSMQPMTGWGAPWGVPAEDGVELAVNQINQAGGFVVNGQRYKIQLHSYDDGDTTKEVGGATQLVQAGCSVILYEGSSGVAVGGVTEAAKTLLIVPGNTPEMTRAGTNYTFIQENAGIGSNFWPAMLSGPGGNTIVTGVKTVAILTENYTTTIQARPGFIAACKAKGFNVVFDETAESDTTDFSTVIARLKQADPDVLFFNSTASATFLNLFSQMKAQNYFPITFGYDSIISRAADTKKIAGSGADGVVEFMAVFANNVQAPDWANAIMGFDPAKRASYTQGMATSYPGNDSAAALMNYDFVYAMVYHMQKANSINTDAIAASMTSGDIYHGAGGQVYWFPQNHMEPMTVILFRLMNINDVTGSCTQEYIGGGTPTDYTYNTWNFTVKTQIDVQKTRSRANLVNASP